ncbi:hypothetical protein R80B4_02865 [Fibrobacteres bacterium R8-0-B4]
MAVKKSVKKPTKKAAKKTYPPAKKAVPKLPRMTIEEFTAVMNERHAKLEAEHAKTEAAQRKTEASIDRLSETVDKLTKSMHYNEINTSEAIKKLTKNLNDSFGGISMRLGRLTEMLVIPKIRQVMNAQGHNFDDAEVNALIRGVVNGRKEDIAEVDMFLSGPDEAMAVEIKTRLRENHVQDHIDQLQNLREHEEYAEIKGKKLFGALVGITVDDKARALAKKKGLYVAEIREEEEKLLIDKPEQCRIW